MTDSLLGAPAPVSIRQTLIDELKRDVCTITFTKVDGTQRTIRGTLMEDYLVDTRLPYDTDKTTSEKVIPFYDVEDEHWKSARLDSLISLESSDNHFVWMSEDLINNPRPEDMQEIFNKVKDNTKTVTVVPTAG